MTVYGTKVAKLIVEPIECKCPHCSTIHTMDMHVFQKYASVLGIPFFPTNKTGVAFCTHCTQALRRREMPENLLKIFYKVKTHTRIPLWTFAGSVLMLLLIIVSLINY